MLVRPLRPCQIGADPQDAVHIGDSEVDVATAHNSGMPCISVTWGFRDKETLQLQVPPHSAILVDVR